MTTHSPHPRKKIAKYRLGPDEVEQRWTDLINIADDLLATYPDSIACIMPEHDDGLDRVLDLAQKIIEANECDPMAP